MKQNFTHKGLTRLYFIMRVSFVNLVLFFLPCLHVLATSSLHGQSIDSTYVSVEAGHLALGKVLKKIEAQTEFLFVFPPDLIDTYGDVSISATRRSVKEVLNMLLSPRKIAYYVNKKNLILYEVSREMPEEHNPTTKIAAPEDKVNVRGVVRDSNGSALPGVSVVVKGLSFGTTTDYNGEFAIEVNDEGAILIFSSIGYKNLEQKVNAQSFMVVVLEEDVQSLASVEIIGTNYFSTTKARSTMDIAKVEGDAIQDQPVTSLLNSVVGRMAGVDITPINGAAGGALTVQVRGNNSLRGNGSYPLYVIDGVQIESSPVEAYNQSPYSGGFDPLSSISPYDIESIEVLKDAGATAIYGSRGANGVIRITTKSGKAGQKRVRVELNGYTGIGVLPKKVDLLSSQEYLTMRREAFRNSGIEPDEFSSPDVAGVWDTTRYTDWQEVLLGKTAKITDFQGGFSGGNEDNSYRVALGVHKESTVYPGDFGFKRVTSSFNFNHAPKDSKFLFSLTLNYGLNVSETFDDVSFINEALTLPPIAPKLYNDNGTLNWQIYPFFGGTFEYHSWQNPLARIIKTHENTSHNLLASGTVGYKLSKDLMFKTVLSVSNFDNSEVVKSPIKSVAPFFIPYSTGQAYFNGNTRSSLMVEPQLDFNRTFAEDHNIQAVAGLSWQQRNSDYHVVQGSGYTSDVLLGSILGAPTVRNLVDKNEEYKYAAAFVHLGYDYRGKYLLDLNARRDGSSRFGPGNRYGNFSAVGVGWIFSEESFFSALSRVVSFGKIKASYGTTGNDQIGDYEYYNTYSIAQFGYQNSISLVPTSLYNPDYAWERTTKMEVAAEFSFFDNRVSVDAAYYRNRSSNQLVNYPLAAATGFISVLSNFDATIQNTGFEFVLNSTNVQKGKFRWTSSLNFTVPRNKLVKFDGIESTPYNDIYKVGEPLSIQRLYTYKGLNSETGLYEVEDFNDSGEIDDKDRQFMRPLGRTIYGGLNNTLSVGNFDISFLFQFSKNPITGILPQALPGAMTNFRHEILDSWNSAGDQAKYQRFLAYPPNSTYYNDYVLISDFNTVDASFIRLKTMAVGYKFPAAIIQKARLSDLRIYIQGQNLITWTNFEGFDPETGYSLPPLRMVTAGIQIKL